MIKIHISIYLLQPIPELYIHIFISVSQPNRYRKPNVYPRYGDIAGTWTQPNEQLDRVHFIEVVIFLSRYTSLYILVSIINNIPSLAKVRN